MVLPLRAARSAPRAWRTDLLLVALCLVVDSPFLIKRLLGVDDGAATLAVIGIGSAALALTLVVRRRWPGAVFAMYLVWGLATLWFAPWYGAVLGPLVALYAFAARRSLAWLVVAWAGYVAVGAVSVYVASFEDPREDPVAATVFGSAVAVAVAAVAYRRPADPALRGARNLWLRAVDRRFARGLPRLHRWFHVATRPVPDPAPPRSRLRRWTVDIVLLAVALFVDMGMLLTWHDPGDDAPEGLLMAVSAAVVLTLLGRRRAPTAVFAVQVGWFGVAPLLVTVMGFPTVGVMAALFALAARRTFARLLGAFAACAAVAGYVASLAVHAPELEVLPRDRVGFAVFLTVLFMIVATVVGSIGYRVPRSAAVRREQESVDRALRDERLMIARELHDIVAHSISIMVLQAAGAKAVIDTDPRRSERALDVIGDAGAQSLDELRRLLHLLRSASGADADAAPLQPDFGGVDALVEQSRAAGLPVDVEVAGAPVPLDPSVSLTAYRLVQEALTNTRKHAGVRARASVRISWNGDGLCVTVEDSTPDGSGGSGAPAVRSTGVGLLGLRERVATVGGELRAEPTPTGFVLQATLPVSRQRPVAAPTR